MYLYNTFTFQMNLFYSDFALTLSLVTELFNRTAKIEFEIEKLILYFTILKHIFEY